MATIQFMIWPAQGHLNSTFNLAKSLKSHGHAVVYSQLFVFEQYIRAEGLDFTPFLAELVPQNYQADQGNPDHKIALHDQLGLLIKQYAITHRKTVFEFLQKELGAIFQRLKTQLLLMDTTSASPLLPLRRESDPPCIMLNTNLRNPYDPVTLRLASDMPTLFLCPQEFDLPHQQTLPQFHYVEASCDLLRKQTNAFQWDRIDEDKKLVYCSLGTQSHRSDQGTNHALHRQMVKHFLEAVINAIAVRPDWQLIMTLGIDFRAEDFHPLPPNVLLVSEAPQLEILKRASLAITHGGFSTVKECIFFGVPLLVFPTREDQPANAARVEHHGLGMVADIETASSESIGSVIDKIDGDPGFKSRINAMREVFLRVEREEPAVTIIEDFVRKHHL